MFEFINLFIIPSSIIISSICFLIKVSDNLSSIRLLKSNSLNLLDDISEIKSLGKIY